MWKRIESSKDFPGCWAEHSRLIFESFVSHVVLVVCTLSENILDNTQPLLITKDITETKICREKISFKRKFQIGTLQQNQNLTEMCPTLP